MSERFDVPVMLRLTTRICHTQSRVTLGAPDPSRNGATGFKPDFDKYVLLPRQAVTRHAVIEDRMLQLAELAEHLEINRAEYRDTEIGIVTSGMCYAYVREAFPQASILQLGMTYPLPAGLIREFASRVERLLVVEELDPFLEEQIRGLGLDVEGKNWVPRVGELTPERLSASYRAGAPQPIENGDPLIPGRAPRICPGCQYLGIFSVIAKLNVTVAGDIGCYTLGSFAPWHGIDTVVCMGASIGTALGMEKALKNKGRGRVLAIIGDGTLLHSGIPGDQTEAGRAGWRVLRHDRPLNRRCPRHCCPGRWKC
jgi:indolepyruvate ferredoxin oxidoreductase alpha subunit